MSLRPVRSLGLALALTAAPALAQSQVHIVDASIGPGSNPAALADAARAARQRGP